MTTETSGKNTDLSEDLNTTALDNERVQLTSELHGLRGQLAEMGISGNRAYYARGTVEKEVWDLRKVWVKRVIELEKRISEINTSIGSKNRKHSERENKIKEILMETFGRDITIKIMDEAVSRNNGGHPMRISFVAPAPRPCKTYKSELYDAISMLIKARGIITRYVMDNEPEINKADYLKKISTLNTCIPSFSDLQKIKIQ